MPKSIQVGYDTYSIIIAESIDDSSTVYNVRMEKNNKKGFIYAKHLILELTEHFGLDFENRTSITYPNVIYKMSENGIVAKIKVKNRPKRIDPEVTE